MKCCPKAKGFKCIRPSSTKGQTRDKTACDECAQTKVKCDSGSPCWQCKRREVTCLYTRRGYYDPYGIFRTQPSDFLPLPPLTEAQQCGLIDSDDRLRLEPADFDLDPSIDFTFEDHLDMFPQSALLNHDFQGMTAQDIAFPDIDSPGMLHPTHIEEHLLYPAGNASDEVGNSPTHKGVAFTNGQEHTTNTVTFQAYFNTIQLDPVEAKCLEIRTLLSELVSSSQNEEALFHLDRQKLVLCVSSYGEHFQPNLPIIHRPSFRIIDTPPALLLAMMLVGACSSEKPIPRAIVDRLAMRLSTWIGKQTVSFSRSSISR